MRWLVANCTKVGSKRSFHYICMCKCCSTAAADPFSFLFTFTRCFSSFRSNDAAIFQFVPSAIRHPTNPSIHSGAVPSKSRRCKKWNKIARSHSIRFDLPLSGSFWPFALVIGPHYVTQPAFIDCESTRPSRQRRCQFERYYIFEEDFGTCDVLMRTNTSAIWICMGQSAYCGQEQSGKIFYLRHFLISWLAGKDKIIGEFVVRANITTKVSIVVSKSSWLKGNINILGENYNWIKEINFPKQATYSAHNIHTRN